MSGGFRSYRITAERSRTVRRYGTSSIKRTGSRPGRRNVLVPPFGRLLRPAIAGHVRFWHRHAAPASGLLGDSQACWCGAVPAFRFEIQTYCSYFGKKGLIVGYIGELVRPPRQPL